jgi:hypothetical protein
VRNSQRISGAECGCFTAPKKEPAEEALPADGDLAARYAARFGAWRFGAWEFRHVPIEGRLEWKVPQLPSAWKEGSEPLRNVIVSTRRNTVQAGSIEGPANAGTASGTEVIKQALK